MLKFFNKKGVSPIIASVLLVVITIAIGATTMAFIRSLTDSNIETAKTQGAKITCGSEVSLEIPIVSNKYQICYNNGTGAMKVLLHNIGSKEIKGFSMTVILNGSIQTTDLITPNYVVAVNEYKEVNLSPSVPISLPSSNISQWRIEPKIQGEPGKDFTICSDSAIIRDIDEVSACT